MEQYQGCQLPDFSLRYQTFSYIADFFTTFLYLLKTKKFLPIPSQNHQQALKNLDFILQKLSVTPDKNWESTHTQLAPVPGQAYGLR